MYINLVAMSGAAIRYQQHSRTTCWYIRRLEL